MGGTARSDGTETLFDVHVVSAIKGGIRNNFCKIIYFLGILAENRFWQNLSMAWNIKNFEQL